MEKDKKKEEHKEKKEQSPKPNWQLFVFIGLFLFSGSFYLFKKNEKQISVIYGWNESHQEETVINIDSLTDQSLNTDSVLLTKELDSLKNAYEKALQFTQE